MHWVVEAFHSWLCGVSSSLCTCGRRRGGTRTAARSATCSWPTTCGTRQPSGPVTGLCHFGREEPAAPEALERLVASVARHLEPGKARAIAAQGLEFAESRPLGGTWALDALWERLGIGPAARGLLKGRRLDPGAERVLFALVANRALAPSSKLAASRWVGEDVLITGLPATSDDACYRAMDWLLQIREQLEKQVFDRASEVLGLEVDLLFFDTTSTYFVTEEADAPVARDQQGRPVPDGTGDGEGPGGGVPDLGQPKDHRDDLPQIVIGMAVTRDGIPLRVWCWPGNTADSALIRQVKDNMRGWSLSRVVWVADRGFTSAENRRYLRRGGNHYIIGERLRSGSPDTEAALSHGRAATGKSPATCGSRKSASPRTSGSSSATTPKEQSATPPSAPAS